MNIDVTINEIIAVTNRKMFYSIILKKGIFVSQIQTIIMLSCKSKTSFLCQNWQTKSFNVFGAFSKSELKSKDCREIGKEWSGLAKLEIAMFQLRCQGS